MHLTLGDLLQCQSWEPSFSCGQREASLQDTLHIKDLWISIHYAVKLGLRFIYPNERGFSADSDTCTKSPALSFPCRACTSMAGFIQFQEFYFRSAWSLVNIKHVANYFIRRCIQYPEYGVMKPTIHPTVRQFCQTPEVRCSKSRHTDLTCASQT